MIAIFTCRNCGNEFEVGCFDGPNSHVARANPNATPEELNVLIRQSIQQWKQGICIDCIVASTPS